MVRHLRVSNAFLVSLLLVALGLSGCVGDDPADPAGNNAGSASPTGAPGGSAHPNASAAPPETPFPPVVGFQVSAADANETNLTVGLDIVFDASNSSDPMGGNLTFEWEFGDNVTAAGPLVNHTYTAAGNYTVTVVATSDASGLASNATMTLAILEALPTGRAPLSLTDPSGDGRTDYHDIRSATMSDDGETITIRLTLGGIGPWNAVDTFVLPDFFIGTLQFEPYRYGAGTLTLWDVTNNARVTGSTVNTAGSEWTITFPIAYLEGQKVAFPFSFYIQMYTGEGLSGGIQPDDRAPNAGSLSYG